MSAAPAAAKSTWRFVVDGFDEEHQRVLDALLSLAGNGIGVRGGPLLLHGTRDRWMFAAGVYDGDGPETRLLVGPALGGGGVTASGGRLHRALDLRTGVLHEQITGDGDDLVAMERFVSLARPGIVAVRTRSAVPIARERLRLVAADDATCAEHGSAVDASWIRVAGSHGGIAAALQEASASGVVDEIVAVVADPEKVPGPGAALERVRDASEAGFDALLAEHRDAWAARWAASDVVIEGDDGLQFATRLALFHLAASVPDTGEAAVGARGLTGNGYRGHVFWDADTFVLPFLAATHPPAARAMLEYRIRRLPAAVATARDLRRAGARFPWESARAGTDVTPPSALDRAGEVVPIRTGLLEEHIVADVAWAACHYVDWTGDEAFARGPGLTLLVESARYWASRVRVERDGSAHLYGVIGPDEYHEPVDDNAFTNVMARWNLRRAADAVDAAATTRAPGAGADPHGVGKQEREHWRELASALIDGYDATTGLYEQCAGFFSLEPLVISEIAPRRPIAADLLLGRPRVRHAQVVKQPDVLMLHHLVPDEVAPDSLEPNLAFYEPRTAHGSSLSPAVYASLFARAGDFRRALDALHIASRIDLDDLTGTTAAGVHVATMGGLWQALAFGFAGVRPGRGRLTVDPHLPPSWPAMEVRVRYRGTPVRVRVEHERFVVTCDAPVDLHAAGSDVTVGSGETTFRRADGDRRAER